jgi:hypothetical protein
LVKHRHEPIELTDALAKPVDARSNIGVPFLSPLLARDRLLGRRHATQHR